ncbi:MAG: FliM/FliN family flagellar motor switch protein [Planctomycetaceae bacterium]
MLDSSQTQQIAKVPVRVTVELGRQRIPLAQLCQLVPGSVLSLSIPAATQVKLLAGKKTLAEGEVVRTGTTLGFRFEGTDAAPASRERIAS